MRRRAPGRVSEWVSFGTTFEGPVNTGFASPESLYRNGRMTYGYARISTDDQSADMQKTALKEAGGMKIFTDDGISGAATR
ncbi:MAG: recombinase family protein [Bryobacteraceae bacterium]